MKLDFGNTVQMKVIRVTMLLSTRKGIVFNYFATQHGDFL